MHTTNDSFAPLYRVLTARPPWLKGCCWAAMVLSLTLLLTSCGGSTDTNTTNKPKSIRIQGSSTEALLVKMIARRFRQDNPGEEILVKGNGSGNGIKALLAGEADIANSSRAMKSKERDAFQKKGVQPRGFVFALDGLAVIINAATGIDDLTLAEVGAIYRGDITNWNELGGEDRLIEVYGRESSSGTFSYFRDKVVEGEYTANMRKMIASSEVVKAVQRTEGSIGYCGIGNTLNLDGEVVPGVKILSIRNPNTGEVISPLEDENVITGRYPLTRPLYQFTPGLPAGEVKDFILFMTSATGQEMVKRNGFYPITPAYEQQNQEQLQAENN